MVFGNETWSCGDFSILPPLTIVTPTFTFRSFMENFETNDSNDTFTCIL